MSEFHTITVEVLPKGILKCEGCGASWSSKGEWPKEAYESGRSAKYVRLWRQTKYVFAASAYCSPLCDDDFNDRRVVR